MIIKYRAVHAMHSWRKVNSHRWVDSAIHGNDGARNLHLRMGRVGKKWADYGAVRCIFVWEESSCRGTALRLQPGSATDLQAATVPVHKLEERDQRGAARTARSMGASAGRRCKGLNHIVTGTRWFPGLPR